MKTPTHTRLPWLALLTAGCIAAASCCGTAQQTPQLSPLPHQAEWGDAAFAASTSYTLVPNEKADADALNLLHGSLSLKGGKVTLLMGARGDEAVARYAEKIPDRAQGYYLKVTPDSVVIAGADGEGCYYGVQTYLQLLGGSKVPCTQITDYPDVAERGMVEGYYGNPFSEEDRLRMFSFFGQQKMNVYIYGPKDDPYHRARWREDYPQAQAQKIAEYADSARHCKVKFVWAIHPGNDIRWTLEDSLNMINKLEKMYALGIRAYAVFFDDIGGEGTAPDRQAGLLNYVTDRFVNKHPDVEPLIMCPTQYNRGWSSGDYLKILGTQSNPQVRIMWTGNSVVDMIGHDDMSWINGQIERPAYIWLNYPVNDYCIEHLLMGPTYGNDLDIAPQLGGFTSNPMEYAEASKLSLFSIADYCWNMQDYDSDASWERAIRHLMPRHANELRIFCENNADPGVTYHGLRRMNESPRFAALAAAFDSLAAAGDTSAATALMRRHFGEIGSAMQRLVQCDEAPQLMAEITPWCQVLGMVAAKGECAMQLYSALQAGDPQQFVDSYLRYCKIDGEQAAVRSRDFPGSIKTPNPVAATAYVVPFIKRSVAQAIERYKSLYDYRTDVFPEQIVENGVYFIKVNGKFLTNAQENVPGSIATLEERRDDIKPQRQEWRISLSPETERYKIVNLQDNRYLNERGAFARSEQNPYEAAWHTYTIERNGEGKFAIRNGGSAGRAPWSSDGTRITPGKSEGERFIFELIPVAEK